MRALIALNLLAGVFILGLLVTSFVAEPFFVQGLGMQRADGGPAPILGGRLIMAIGLASVPLAHILLTRLLGIVGTVGSGDPFVSRNAERLRACAWTVLGLEGMHLLVGAVSAASPIDIGWSFSPIGLLAVLLLFVLAQVFAEGARMRDDLEGTV
ncbi:DUF2975 domain-containing protein [Sphingomonas sp. JC676]|uniref:DUF2975 domain-containing protein n=1 Tax=Sphingomonas sp. JC676 TaxID=2768065 RepID=UPI0016578206|nr:DUF2975 domain-containing protein [Sphingomonas sp. JC676]MBC9031086.1 DUF2975 domain-containing protein [Sphingomonas sp. JC676]